MIIFIFLLLIISLYKMKFLYKEFNKEYMSRESTLSINGIFVIFVFLSHIKSYTVMENNIYDRVYYVFSAFMGQLVVVTFLFYSGYGIMESIKRKKEKYINTFIRNKFLTLWLKFDIAVLCYFVLNSVMGIKYNYITNIMSLFAWENVGNSNWYVFTIMFLYLMTYISFKCIKNNNFIPIFVIFIMCILYSMVCIWFKNGQTYWFDTIIVYPFGMLYSTYKANIEKYFKAFYYRLVFVVCICILLCYKLLKYSIFIYWILAVSFVLLIVAFTMKVKMCNKYLVWIGKYVFEIYIFQRIPMIILSRFEMSKYIIVLLSFVCTLCISVIMNKVFMTLDNKIKK